VVDLFWWSSSRYSGSDAPTPEHWAIRPSKLAWYGSWKSPTCAILPLWVAGGNLVVKSYILHTLGHLFWPNQIRFFCARCGENIFEYIQNIFIFSCKNMIRYTTNTIRTQSTEYDMYAICRIVFVFGQH
jgi:hypothetical protein